MIGTLAIASLAAASAGAGATISGTADYRERMLLPPGAVFEATLEDVSRADAPATVLGRALLESPKGPPFRFAIEYDPAAVDARHRYAVRARITLDGRLLFTTDTAHPVLGPSGPTTVELLLKRVSPGPPRPEAPRLSLRAEGSPQRLRGTFTYVADAGVFTDCASTRKMPVAPEGDNAALEAAYLRARSAPGAAVLVAVDGRIEMRLPMEGNEPRPTLVVERFVEVQPAADCSAVAPAPPLENTYWKLVSLRGEPVRMAEKQKEPHLVLQAGGRLAGSGGCNRLIGSYTREGEALSFGRTAGTLMACPQGMELERAFLETLAQVRRWRTSGQQLELADDQGRPVALFEAVYLK